MSIQYKYNTIPGQQVYDQKNILYQYNAGSNPLDPLGLNGANYIIADTQQTVMGTQNVTSLPTKTYSSNADQQRLLAQNQVYMQQIKLTQPVITNSNNPAHLQKYQAGQNIGMDLYQVNPYQIQNQVIPNQPIVQPQIKQNINQQVIIQQKLPQNQQILAQKGLQPNQIQQNYQHVNKSQQIQQNIIPQVQNQLSQHHHQQYPHQKIPAQINPQIQQKINSPANFQQNQKQIINPQIKPQQQINIQNQPHAQIKNQISQNQKKPPQEQPKVQPKINQQQNQPQLAQNQNQIKGVNPAQYYYQNFVQSNQNPNQNKINIQYNKNDEHFVNKPIFPEKKNIQEPISTIKNNNIPVKKKIDDTPTLLEGTKILGKKNINKASIVNNNNNINNMKLSKTPYAENLYKTKINPSHIIPNLSEIKEEEIDIKQSGLSKKVSGINNSGVKESPMEEKKPEKAFPEDIIEVNNKNNITQKSITESGISDFTDNMDHLPTINSIMKGNAEPLPPSKKKKYKK